MVLSRFHTLLLAATLGLSGCATVTTGTRQPFAVQVVGVDSADCTLQKPGYGPMTIVSGQTTSVPRGEAPLTVRCSHPGFQAAGMEVESHVQDRAKYELPFGMLIDYLSGARYEYPAQITLTLSPVLASLSPNALP